MSEPSEWKSTACSLCYINCGVEVRTDGRAITRVRGDKNHPHSQGYLCQKAQRLTFLGDHVDRLTSPLRRRADGTHEEIGWDEAIDEIASRLLTLKAEDEAAGRPSSLAYYGGGGQGNHSGGPYGLGLLAWMGSTRYFNALSQEKTGDFWVNGHLFGSHACHTAEGMEDSELLVVLGCNPWMAHGFRNARTVVNEIKNDDVRSMIVIDPRRTETAAVADLHLALRPGTDAFLLPAMLAMIVERGGHDMAWLDAHTAGFDDVRRALEAVPIRSWVDHADVPMADVERAVEMIIEAESMTVRAELGIQQGRHSTLNSYLEKLLFLVTGNFGRRGTNGVHSWLQPLWSHSDRDASPVSGIPNIAGLLPTNTLPQEILADHPHRARALWVESGNPANTAADTQAMEAAIDACDLSVVVDVAYTETAQRAEFVLPAAAQHEKWEYTLFTFEWPHNYFQVRPPLFRPLEGTLPESEMYGRLFRALDALPSDDEIATLTEAARTDRENLLDHAMPVILAHPGLEKIVPSLLQLTFEPLMPDGASHAAPLWFGCHQAAKKMPRQVQRALGTELEGRLLGEELFDRLFNEPSGIMFSEHEYDEIWELIPNDRIRLAIPEMLDWLATLDPADEQPDPDFPISLLAGQRRSHNANQILRDPAWRKTDPDGALRVHPDDMAAAGLAEGDWVAVVSRGGRLIAPCEVDETLRRGQAALPHGYGMTFPDGKGGQLRDGPRLNVLTSADHCDPVTATPYHKDVPVRLEPATVD